MKITSWNCQGAGNMEFHRNFRELVRVHQPHVVYLLETRVSEENARLIAPTLGFSRWEIAPTVGREGGIWMLRNEEVIYVEVIEIEYQSIHAIIGPQRTDPWLISGIYAQPRKQEKVRLFNKLEGISRNIDLSWLVTGDFNEVGFSHEKYGGKVTSVSRLMSFQGRLAACGLHDLGFKGPAYTWVNKREDGARIKERIDRAVANNKWIDKFQEYAVLHLPRTHEDHHPIMTDTQGAVYEPNNRHSDSKRHGLHTRAVSPN